MRIASLISLLLLAGTIVHAQDLPSCARPEESRLIIPGDSVRLHRFAACMRDLKRFPNQSATIWHIGGSHVQAGWFSSRMRHNFDSLGHYPSAGRGYIFPYPLAHTNFDRSFRVGYEGEWEGTRSSNPNKKVPVQPSYGIMGIAAYTADTLASFSLYTPAPFQSIHIMAEASDSSVMPILVAGTDTVRCVRDVLLRGYYAELPSPVDTLQVLPMLEDGQHFTITGLLPQMPGVNGLTYLSTGVNGARITTWLERCPEFRREMSLVHPDLVILGLGINDSTMPAADFRPDRFKNNYRRLLDTILEESPDCAFIFISNNDSWRYVRRGMAHNDNGEAVRQAMFELAREYDGALWDLFGIMGGNESANEWRDAGLMKEDRLHFTREGYELLGDMLYRAIEDLCE